MITVIYKDERQYNPRRIKAKVIDYTYPFLIIDDGRETLSLNVENIEEIRWRD